MAPEEKPSFWTTLPGILTAAGTLITAVTGLIVALNWGGPPANKPTPAVVPAPVPTATRPAETPPGPALEIVGMSSRNPDHLVLKNVGATRLDVSGYLFKEGKHECAIPADTSIAAGETFTAYFFSEKNAGDAESREAEGDFVCSKTFGIGPQELIQVLTPGRELVVEKRAP